MNIIGHRGARGLAPENTIAGLQKALDHHAKFVEFDVRVTKDGVPILHHDARTPGHQSVNRVTYEQFKHHVPDLATLDEALATLMGKAHVYIEVKPRQPIKAITKVLDDYVGSAYEAGDIWLASKHQKTLRQLHVAYPEIAKIVIHPWSGVIATRRAKQVDSRLIAMNQRWLWRGFIRSMARRGWLLIAYTVNDKAKAHSFQDSGLYGLVTDYPDLFDQSK